MHALKVPTMILQILARCSHGWEDYPLIIVATSDRDHKFHPFAVVLCKGESGDDFEFIFRALLTYNPEWYPPILLSDGSAAIKSGFELVFGRTFVRLQCHFHMLKNNEKYLKSLPKKGLTGAGELRTDLMFSLPKTIILQTCCWCKACVYSTVQYRGMDTAAKLCPYFCCCTYSISLGSLPVSCKSACISAPHQYRYVY